MPAMTRIPAMQSVLIAAVGGPSIAASLVLASRSNIAARTYADATPSVVRDAR